MDEQRIAELEEKVADLTGVVQTYVHDVAALRRRMAADDVESDGDYLDRLAAEIRKVNAANGWNVTTEDDWTDPYKIPAVLMLCDTESAEACEAFREDDKDGFLEELADMLIRTLDLAGGFTQNFTTIVKAKVNKNRGRGHRHGGKRI